MGLLDKINQQKDIPQQKVDENALSKEEIELILLLIKQSNFRGEHVEILYNTVLKLQNQYLKQQ